MNLRPSGYEPDELPDCSTPRYFFFERLFIIPHPRRECKSKFPLFFVFFLAV